jgi:hypothetical protein
MTPGLPMSTQAWKEAILGSQSGHGLVSLFASMSYGKTLLKSYDFVGPISMGCPT